MPTFHRKNRRGTAARHIRPHYRPISAWRREPFQKFCDRSIESDFDSACWFETSGGAAIAIQIFADRREDTE